VRAGLCFDEKAGTRSDLISHRCDAGVWGEKTSRLTDCVAGGGANRSCEPVYFLMKKPAHVAT
jgi:hypothetical protein